MNRAAPSHSLWRSESSWPASSMIAPGRADDQDDFKPLFNGKDLEGWEATQPELWSVKDGMIIGKQGKNQLKKNTFLATKEKYTDFVLKASVRLVKNEGNSGIQFRTRILPDGTARGYQADVAKGYWGLLLEEGSPKRLIIKRPAREAVKGVKPDEWNDYEITAKGHHITLVLNGIKSVDLDDPKGDLERCHCASVPRGAGDGSAIQGHQDQGIERVSPDPVRRMAIDLLADYDGKTPGRLSCQPAALTVAQAYAVQAEVGRLREQRGERIIGYKVGCTSKAIQEQLGVQEPIFGRLFDTGCFRSGACLSHASFANLAVEGELAVRLGDDLCGPDVSVQACRNSIEDVFPVIELHHYVVPADRPHWQWLITSGGMHAGFVADEKGPGRRGLGNSAHSLSIAINDVIVGAVGDTEPLLCPIGSLRWLADRLAKIGLSLRKGQVILTGSPMKLYPVAALSRVVVEAPPLGVTRVEIGP